MKNLTQNEFTVTQADQCDPTFQQGCYKLDGLPKEQDFGPEQVPGEENDQWDCVLIMHGVGHEEIPIDATYFRLVQNLQATELFEVL